MEFFTFFPDLEDLLSSSTVTGDFDIEGIGNFLEAIHLLQCLGFGQGKRTPVGPTTIAVAEPCFLGVLVTKSLACPKGDGTSSAGACFSYSPAYDVYRIHMITGILANDGKNLVIDLWRCKEHD